MSFLHLLYVGHFEHEGNFIRFRNTPTDPLLKPVIRYPLNMDEVKRVAQQAGIQGTGSSPFPDEYPMWVEDGYLVGDRYALDREAIDLILRLVRVTKCELVDFNARSVIRPEELAPPGITQAVSSLSGIRNSRSEGQTPAPVGQSRRRDLQ
jgi:hypothetical protein